MVLDRAFVQLPRVPQQPGESEHLQLWHLYLASKLIRAHIELGTREARYFAHGCVGTGLPRAISQTKIRDPVGSCLCVFGFVTGSSYM